MALKNMHCIKNLRSCSRISSSNCLFGNSYNLTSCRYLFFESNPRGEYKKDDDKSILYHIKNGWKMIGKEFKLLYEESKEKFACDPIINYYPGEIDKQWVFRNQSDLDAWVTSCDSDNNEGFSKCEFTISKSGCGLFTGTLDPKVPKDGRIKRAGYCAVRCARPMKSFMRESYFDWAAYTHLVIKLRGDGRTYMINLATSGYHDNLWNDVYHYMLFTRGGPYWQVAKIPFSKFFFASKGRIQDIQHSIPLDAITNVGFTCGDKIKGPFSLEIDYIGLEYNPVHDEEFAYEMYKLPRFIAGQ